MGYEELWRNRASLLKGNIQKDVRRKDVLGVTRGWRDWPRTPSLQEDCNARQVSLSFSQKRGSPSSE